MRNTRVIQAGNLLSDIAKIRNIANPKAIIQTPIQMEARTGIVVKGIMARENTKQYIIEFDI